MIKKNTFLFLFLLAPLFTVMGQVQVGIGANTEQKIPFNAGFGYSYSQSIYLASEINAAGNITSIQWYYAGSGDLANSQELVLYMGTTAKGAFESTTDWVPASELTQVYSGNVTTNETPGWKTISLAMPFPYNGSGNLIIAVDENKELGDGYDDTFRNSAVTGLRSIYVYADYDNPDPASPPEAYGLAGFVPTVILGGITQACPTPYYINVDAITTTTAQLSWQAPADLPAGGSDYYIATSDSLPSTSTLPTGSISSGETIGIIDLVPETIYYIWARNNCGSALFSGWSSIYSFKTDCLPAASFNENFDDATVPDLPSCWNKILRGGSNLSPYARIETSESQSQSPANSVVMDSDESDQTLADIILVSPRLSTLSAGTYRLKFYAKGNGILQIGTLSTNDSSAVFTENSAGDIGTNSMLAEYAVDFSNYTGTDHYIGIRLATTSSKIYLDNILWEILPSCPDVTAVTIPFVSENGATIEWMPGNPAASMSWDVVIGSPTDNNPDGLDILNSATSVKEITGLSENTDYKAWVRTVCSSENGAWIGPVPFRTACHATADLYEDFNDAGSPDLPGCWTTILRGSGLSEFAMIETNLFSDMFESPNTAVQLFNENSGPLTDIILVSPNLSTLSSGTYRLKFYAKHSGNPVSLDIVTLNSNTSSAEVNLIQTVGITDETNQYLVEFNSYYGSDPYIGFRLNATDTYSSAYVDNILWEINPTCPDISLIEVTGTTASGATLNWMESGAEASWDVAVGTGTENPALLPFTNYDIPSASIGNLLDDTGYNVWVRSVCTNDDKGAWIGPVAFTTACLAVPVFNENFETAATPGLPSCWSKIIRGQSVSANAYIETSPYSNLPDPTTAIVMNTSDSMESDDIILVSPNLSTLGLGSYRLKFKAKGEATLQIGSLNSNTPSAVFNSIQTITTTNVPTEYVVDFTNYTGSDLFIGIRAGTVAQYTYVELDDIIWQPIPLCPDVTELKKTGTTMASATISWNGAVDQEWEIVMGDATTTDPDTITGILTSETSHTFDLLTAGTTYKVWARTHCTGSLGNGEWEGPLTIMTQCTGTALPYLEDFETALDPGLPDCTSSLNLAEAPSSWYTNYFPGYGFESRALVYLGDLYTDANSWFFTRGVNLTEGESYTVSYRYGGASTDTFYYNNNLRVLYGTEASPAGMTLPIVQYLDFAVDEPVSQTITITPPSSGVYYFGFNVTSLNNSYYMYIDDIAIDAALANDKSEKEKFSYYPNPVKDVLTVSYRDPIDSVSIYTILGQEIATKPVRGNLAQIDMHNLSKGTYILKVMAGKTIKNIKVMKS